MEIWKSAEFHDMVALHLIFLLIALLAPIVAGAQEYNGPKCLGAFCVDREVSTETLARRLGPLSKGFSAYKSPDGRTFLGVMGEGMHPLHGVFLRGPLTKSVDTTRWATSKENLGKWTTGEGIGLGSSEEDVRKAYGKPSGEVDLLSQEHGAVIEGKKKTMFYKGRLDGQAKVATFRIVEGEVSEIELENDGFIGPDCLSAACVIQGSSLRSLLTRLGSSAQKGSPWSPYYCYHAENDGTFLYLAMGHGSTPEVEAVEVSDFPNCARTSVAITKSDLRQWKTPEGIGLGTSEEEVLRVYGKPTGIGHASAESWGVIRGHKKGDSVPDMGDKTLAYSSSELEQVVFGIRSGKVSYILVSDEE